MSLSLHDVSIANYVQALRGVETFIAKGIAHCEANGSSLHELLETRIHPDMQPLRFQLIMIVHYSLGVVESLKVGEFGPPPSFPDADLATLAARVTVAKQALEQYTPEQINAYSGKDVIFKTGDMVFPFTAENFVMSFSLPNLYFHITTAYNILRSKGVEIGKREYLGGIRAKG